MDVEEESKSSLESPLIHQRPLQDDKCIDKAGMIVELKRQMQLAGPLVLVSFLQYSFQMISVMFVGHLGDLSLSSASMATSFAGVTGFSYMVFNIAFTFPITLLNHILAYALYTCTTVLILSIIWVMSSYITLYDPQNLQYFSRFLWVICIYTLGKKLSSDFTQ